MFNEIKTINISLDKTNIYIFKQLLFRICNIIYGSYMNFGMILTRNMNFKIPK